jgi:prepilin-type N-terminal cleavage/methylation domain-containing protein
MGTTLRNHPSRAHFAAKAAGVRKTTYFRHTSECGFTLIELMVVATICMILAGIMIPKMLTSMHDSKLRGVLADFSSLVELSRIYAIRDNRFYSLYVLAASGSTSQQAYVDMLPRSLTGASGNGGASVATGDPVVAVTTEVAPQAASNAPTTSNLSGQLFPSTTTVPPTDASSTSTPLTFGPRGLPCLTLTVTSGSASGTVCDSSAGPVAYWIFFKDGASGNWGAITITPAGRIQKWYYESGSSTWDRG